jgi:hypothetical protein
MECAPGTVKSRLNYARQQIKKGVEEYERKGVKLYGMGAVPILTILLREEAESLLIPQALAGGLAALLGQIAGSGAGVGGAGAAAAAQASGAATQAAASTGTAVTAKIIAGVVAVAVITAGAVAVPRLTQAPHQAQAPPAVVDTIEDGEETPAEESYYNSLSDEHKQMLSRLESALRDSDYQTAYDIQGKADFRTLCDLIPELNGWQNFWYYPDNETSIHVFVGNDSGMTIRIFLGRNGNGVYYCSRYGGSTYENFVMDVLDYSDGLANGSFERYIMNYGIGQTEFVSQRGNLRNGAADGSFFNDSTGGWIEYEYDPDWYAHWPDWPER